jgi:hypothetical protein
MLVRFEVTNFRSLRDSAELSMVAVDRDRAIVRGFDRLGEGLLPIAGIYGPNASGKSNIISALDWLVRAIPDSRRFWDEAIPTEPFVFDSSTQDPTEFEIELMVDEVRYAYQLEVTRDRVTYEGLWHYPKGRRRKIFERKLDELTFQAGLGALSGTRQLLTPRSLALALTHRFESPIVSNFVKQLSRIQVMKGVSVDLPHRGTRVRIYDSKPLTNELFQDEPQSQDSLFNTAATTREPAAAREQALALLRLADLGITDVTMDQVPHFDNETGQQRNVQRLRLVHSTETGALPLDFQLESEGTQAWFMHIGPILQALSQGSLLVVDELDSTLHPKLTSEILRLFLDPDTNPRGAQLIVTAHDTNLLSQLNRDEVWLTEKGPDAATRVGALAEFAGESVRRSVNLGPAYLAGRFGSLPQIYQGDLRRVLEKLM